jgi:hypothetical protein
MHINPLNAKLNPICHLLALLGAHPILHVSRVRVKLIAKQLNSKTPEGTVLLSLYKVFEILRVSSIFTVTIKYGIVDEVPMFLSVNMARNLEPVT